MEHLGALCVNNLDQLKTLAPALVTTVFDMNVIVAERVKAGTTETDSWVAERLKATVLNAVEGHTSVGSNPTPTANLVGWQSLA